MMVLSRKANDQNRTILVIYSNHRPTSFGIITKNIESNYHIPDRLMSRTAPHMISKLRRAP